MTPMDLAGINFSEIIISKTFLKIINKNHYDIN